MLVVDDNETNRLILREMLQSWNLRPAIASDGKAGVAEMQRAAAAGAAYDLALIDFMMPEMDGLELAQRVRQDPQLQDCPLMILSSAGRIGDADTLKRLNIANCLTKPIKKSDLFNALHDLFTSRCVTANSESMLAKRPRETPALRILLAEDNAVNQRVAVAFLEQRGHHVTVAVNGKEAVDKVAEEDFDIVLMDVHMPELDGLAATQMIRATAATSGEHIPIVAMTASAMQSDQEDCLQAGMDGYIAKPVHAEELYAAIEGMFPRGPRSGIEQRPKPAECTRCEPSPLNWDATRKLIPGGEAELRELTQMFLNLCHSSMSQISDGLSQQDARTVHRAAHTLRGSAAIFAADGVVNAAWQLEQIAHDEKLEQAPPACEALKLEVQRLIPALAEMLQAGSPASA